MLEIGNGPQLAIEVEYQAVLQIVGRRHRPLVFSLRRGKAGASVQDQQLARGCSQQLDPVLMNDHGVLDPNAASPGQVHTRLDRHRDGCGQSLSGEVGAEERSLVDLQANPVAEAMAEVLTEPGIDDDGARSRVNLGRQPAHPKGIATGLLGTADRLVDLPLPSVDGWPSRPGRFWSYRRGSRQRAPRSPS